MQTIWNHVLSSPSSSAIKCGVIGPSNKSIIVGNPLEYFSYDPFGQTKALTSPRSLTTIMKLSNNGRFLALASEIVDLMDLERGKVVRQFTEHTNTITGICSNNSTPHIWATVGSDKTMRIFDSRIHPGQVLCLRNDYRHRCITYAPNSMMLFCGGDNIFIFDVRMNTEFNSIKTTNQVYDLNCHPEDCVVLGCTDDRMIKVWDIDTRECVSQSFPLESQPQKVLFEAFGKAVIACTNQKLYAFDWEPFQVLSQHSWSASKQSKLMTLNGENQFSTTSLPSQSDNNFVVDTLDIRNEDGLIMHLGISRNAKLNENLSLRTIQVEHLLASPEGEVVDDKAASSVNQALSSPSEDFNTSFEEASLSDSTSTSATTTTPIKEEKNMAGALLVLEPRKTDANSSFIRKLPRSTSSSRNLLPSSPKKSVPVAAAAAVAQQHQQHQQPTTSGGGSLRARSSSTHSLHSTIQRNDSGGGGNERKLKEPSVIQKSGGATTSSSSQPRLRHGSGKPPKGGGGGSSSSSGVSRPTQHQQQIPRGKSIIRNKNEKTFEDIKQTTNDFIKILKNRKMGIQKVKAVLKSRHCNEDEVFDESINLPDKTIFVHLLQQMVSKPINLKLAARILPELRNLFSHKNPNFIDVSLDILNGIVTQLYDPIRQGLSSNAQNIGVDIAAEQRQLLCIKCKEALTEIYVNSHFIIARLNEEQKLYFNSTIDKLTNLVS